MQYLFEYQWEKHQQRHSSPQNLHMHREMTSRKFCEACHRTRGINVFMNVFVKVIIFHFNARESHSWWQNSEGKDLVISYQALSVTSCMWSSSGSMLYNKPSTPWMMQGGLANLTHLLLLLRGGGHPSIGCTLYENLPFWKNHFIPIVELTQHKWTWRVVSWLFLFLLVFLLPLLLVAHPRWPLRHSL